MLDLRSVHSFTDNLPIMRTDPLQKSPLKTVKKIHGERLSSRKAIPYKEDVDFELRKEHIDSIFDSINEIQCTKVHPIRPKGGTIYVYKPDGDHQQEDWRCDGYAWDHMGTTLFTKNNPRIKKYRFYTSREAGVERNLLKAFRRYGFHRMLYGKEDRSITIIHYLGDETVQPNVILDNQGNYVGSRLRSCPYVFTKVQDQILETGEGSSDVIKSNPRTPSTGPLRLKSPTTDSKGLMRPTSKKATIPGSVRTVKRGGFHALVSSVDSFLLWSQTAPQFISVFGNSQLLAEVNRILSVPSTDHLISIEPMTVLRDAYLGCVTVRLPIFAENPVIPLLFVITDKVTPLCQEVLFKCLSIHLPVLKSRSIVCLFEGTREMQAAQAKELPRMRLAGCWNQLRNEVKRFAILNSCNTETLVAYNRDLVALLETGSLIQFEQMYRNLSSKWSSKFVIFFETQLQSRIVHIFGKWRLEKMGVYFPFLGISFLKNKEGQDLVRALGYWGDVTYDNVVMAFHLLSAYHLNEVRLGLCQLGNFTLKAEFDEMNQDLNESHLTSYVLPNQIIRFLIDQNAAVDPQEGTSSKPPPDYDVMPSTDAHDVSYNMNTSPRSSISSDDDMPSHMEVVKKRKVRHHDSESGSPSKRRFTSPDKKSSGEVSWDILPPRNRFTKASAKRLGISDTDPWVEGLTRCDEAVLMRQAPITVSIIRAATHLLSVNKGLPQQQDPEMGYQYRFGGMLEDGLQMIRLPNQHWVCVSLINREVHLFDSAPRESGELPPELRRSLAELFYWLADSDGALPITAVACQAAGKTSQSALLALSWCTSVAHKRTEAYRELYTVSRLRPHLHNCLCQGELTPFPSVLVLAQGHGPPQDLLLSPFCCNRYRIDETTAAPGWIYCSQCEVAFHPQCIPNHNSARPFVCETCMQKS